MNNSPNINPFERQMLVCLLALFALLTMSMRRAQGQDNTFSPFVSGGFQYGFILKSSNAIVFNGMNGRIGFKKQIKPKLDISLSAGIAQYDDQRYYPLSLGGHIHLNENSTSFFSYQLGYAFAHFNSLSGNNVQDLSGGLIHRVFWEKKLFSLQKLDVALELGIKHQRGVYLSENYRTNFGISSFHTGIQLSF